MSMSNFWDKYGESVEQETKGGPSVIGMILVELGYKVYTGDVEQPLTWFPVADPTNAELRAAALAKANGLGEQVGRRAQYGVQITRFKDSTIRLNNGVWEDVTWSQDLQENTDAWRTVHKARNGNVKLKNPTTGEKVTVAVEDIPGGLRMFDLVVASLDAVGIGDSLPWKGFATLQWLDDPESAYFGEAGMTDTDQNDAPRFPQVVCISEVFESLDAARTACGLETSGKPASTPASDAPPLPADWEGYADAWLAEMKAIKAEYPGPLPKVRKALEAAADKLAADHSCTPADVLAWYEV